MLSAMWWWNIRFLSSPSKLNWTGEASCQPQRFFPKSSRSNSRKCCWPQGNFPALENWRQKAKFRNKQFEERKFMSCAAAVGALLLHVYWSVVKLSRVDHVGWSSTTHKTVWRSIFTQRKDAIEFQNRRPENTVHPNLFWKPLSTWSLPGKSPMDLKQILGKLDST